MKEIYLISPNFVRTNTNISSNIQDKFLQSAIREATDMDLHELVGSNLLNKLKIIIDKDEINIPENIIYKQILDISKYFIAYSVVSRLTVISSIKIDNIGANVTGDDNVKTLDLDDIFRIEKFYRDKADFYKKRIQDFLRENYSKIPELSECECYKVKSNTYSAASTGIWLGGTRGSKSNRACRLRDKYEYNN